MAIVEVVKYNGKPDVFAWKYPSEELGTWTQLIVNDAQEAVLVKSGKALDVFGSGRYTLSTANIPILNNIINLPFGGRSPFTAEVWYINKAYNLDIKWGTPSPIQIQDPKYGIFAPVRANGAFGIHVSDSKKFLIKLATTTTSFDAESIKTYFRSIYVTKVKDAIATYLTEKGISVLEITAYIEELSQYMKDKVKPVMDEYGIELVSFYVNEISFPEDDTAVIQLKNALAKKAEMEIIGYSYQQERSFDTLEGAAKNTGSGVAPLVGAGMGLGMGMGMGQGVGKEFSNIIHEINIGAPKKAEIEEAGLKCAACGNAVPADSKFCPECGAKINYCPSCGAKIDADFKFCTECGTALTKSCPKCEKPIDGDDKFCPECGEKL